MLFFFPRGVLDEILNLIESVSEGFPSYSCMLNFEKKDLKNLTFFYFKTKLDTIGHVRWSFMVICQHIIAFVMFSLLLNHIKRY